MHTKVYGEKEKAIQGDISSIILRDCLKEVPAIARMT